MTILCILLGIACIAAGVALHRIHYAILASEERILEYANEDLSRLLTRIRESERRVIDAIDEATRKERGE